MMSTSDTTAATSTTTTASHDPAPAADQTSTITRDQEQQQPAAAAAAVVDDKYLDSFPVGYRFMPTDEEVLHYLALRYQKIQLPPNRINEVHLYDHHPEYLTSPGRFKAYENEEWYFFTSRDRKYRNGDRPKRSAGTGDSKGYWKATGVDKKIQWDEVKKTKLGSKKTLVYYLGKAPKGTKTNWVMHEFQLDQTSIQKNSRADMLLNDSVLCRIHIKKTKSSDSISTTTSSGSRKKKPVHHDHALSSPPAEEEEEEKEDLQEEDEEEDLQEEEDLSVRGETTDIYNDMEDEHLSDLSVRGETTDIYNDMEDEHLSCSDYDSIFMQQNSPTDLHQILNNNNSSCSTTGATYSSSNIMGAISSFSTTSTVVRGTANIMPLQTCPPNWDTAPVLNDCYMVDTSGSNIVAPDMISMSAIHNTHSNNIRQGYDQTQQWGYSNSMLMNSLSSLMVQDAQPRLPDQQWVSSISSLVPGRLPSGHPPLPDRQGVSSLSSFVPAGHPPLSQILKVVPQGYSPSPLPQMPPQMPSQMQQQGYHHHHQQHSSSSWADGSSSSSGINRLHDHAIRRECRERHMASKQENDNNSSTNEDSEYLNGLENILEGIDQTPFSKASW